MKDKVLPSNENFILLRGVPLPSKLSTKQERYLTNAAYEIAMNSKKWGNFGRSVSLAFGVPPFSTTGFCIFNPDFSRFISISSLDEDTGRAKKENFIFIKRLTPEKVEEELRKLLELQLKGGRERAHARISSVHSEITYDIRIFDLSAIYFFTDDNFDNADKKLFVSSPQNDASRELLIHHSAILQAVFLQQEYERINGKVLPIYEYSKKYNSLIEQKPLSDDELISLWEEIVSLYLEIELSKNPLRFVNLSLKESKFIAVYDDYSDDFLSPDYYYPDNLKLGINERLAKVLDKYKDSAFNLLGNSNLSASYEKQKNSIDDDFSIEIAKHSQFDIELVCQHYMLLYIDEKRSKKRNEVLKKLLTQLFLIYFNIESTRQISFNEIKKFVANNDNVNLEELYEIIHEYAEQTPLNHKHIIDIYELISTLKIVPQQKFFSLIKSSCDLVLDEEPASVPVDKTDLIFLDLAKKLGSSNEKISSYALDVLTIKKWFKATKNDSDEFNTDDFIELTEYIKFRDESLDISIKRNNLATQKAVLYIYENVKKRLIELNKFKDFSLLKTKMNELFLKNGCDFSPSTNAIISKTEASLIPSKVDKYINIQLSKGSFNFFSSAEEIPFQELKQLMPLYLPQNYEIGSLPLKPFKLLIILGIRITLRNPYYFEWYLKKISKLNLPTDVEDILEKILKNTLDYYPDFLKNSNNQYLLALLHPEFHKVLKSHQVPVPLSFAKSGESIATKMISFEGQEALIYCWENYLSKMYQNENKATYFPILYLNKDNQITFSPAKFYSAYIKGEKDSNIVYRTNHGLPHTSCTLYYVRPVIEFKMKHGSAIIKNYIISQTLTPYDKMKFISKLQIAMAFYVTGREGEQGFATPEYPQYRAQSAKNFFNYVIHKDLLGTLFEYEELEIYRSSLTSPHGSELNGTSWSGSVYDRRSQLQMMTLKIIMHACHCADLSRLWSPKKISADTVKNLLKGIDKVTEIIKHEAFLIFKIAAKLNGLMGNSVMTDYDVTRKKCIRPKIKYCDLYNTPFPKTDLEKFMHYSTNPEACIQLLNSLSPEDLLKDDNDYSFAKSYGLFTDKTSVPSSNGDTVFCAKSDLTFHP